MAYRIDLSTLARRESEQVEWKENVADIHDVVATITAFANDISNLGGGYVVCGSHEVTDEHGFQSVQMVGLTASRLKEIEGKVLAACQRHVTPPIVPLVDVIPAMVEDRRVLVFTVASTAEAHQYRTGEDGGRYYVRLSHRTVEARNGLLRELLVRKGPRPPWDKCWHPEATIDDIDLIAFRDLLHQLGLWSGNGSLDHYLDPAHAASPFVPSFCVREPLTDTLRPRNFTLLLAGRSVQRFYPDAHAIFSMYAGADRSEPFAERTQIGGTLIAQARQLIERLNTEAILLMDKSSGAPPNAHKYPERALHEAVVNALVHRDYEAAHPVRVTAFSDRIEVMSPGSLPSAVRLDLFHAGRAAPIWRNQALAWFLVKLNLAQAEGQGIATILRTMRDEGCPTPEFRITPASLECVLPAHPRHQVMRDLQRAQRFIALGRFGEAAGLVDGLLAVDPFNFRVIEIFCEVNRAALRPDRVMAFVERLGEQVHTLPAGARMMLAEALAEGGDEMRVRRSLELTREIVRDRRDQRQAIDGMGDLLAGQETDQALAAFDQVTSTRSNDDDSPEFLYLRGLNLLQLAQRCRDTARNTQGLSARKRRKTWDECHRWLDEAERNLRAATEREPDAPLRDQIDGQLTDLARFRAAVIGEE